MNLGLPAEPTPSPSVVQQLVSMLVLTSTVQLESGEKFLTCQGEVLERERETLILKSLT